MSISFSIFFISFIIVLLLGVTTNGSRCDGILIIIFSIISLGSAFTYSTLCFIDLAKENSWL